MDKKYSLMTKISSNPGKRWGLVTLFLILLSLGYMITKSHYHKKSNYIKQTVELPSLDEEAEQSLPQDDNIGWKTITTRPGDTLGRLFSQSELSQQTLQAVLHNNPYAKTLTNIKPNQQIQFLIHDHVLEKIMFPLNATEFLIVSQKNEQYITKIKARTMDAHEDYITATVRGSLYGTAQQKKIPPKLIQQMIEIFNWEIDFAKDIHSGDHFSILYKAFYVDDTLVSTGEILAVSYTARDMVHQAIRHTNDNGDDDYYTPEGTSLKKAFTRYPVKFSHISSTYSRSRYHAILHYNRPHKGVDLAAAIGTPIYATGDGRVQIIGRQNGYGNMIKLIHNKTYASIYGHLLKFQKGLSKGDYVKRGQIIGYVGQTGLATGPHCHYEFHVNQEPKNPTTIKLPRAAPISARERLAFHAKANRLLASLKLYEDSTLADAKSKRSTNTG
ncbi:MAG: peptidoglycan DD-metalloendopeptidase family protein [Legionellaceae bacterium]|nr:peptidoglycan DD-metalloendopeptidase family protein [Legionellaceae bacterium]